MQVNAFGFPLGTSTPGGLPAGAPTLGFLQALGVAGAGQAVAPTGGPAVLPVSSLTSGGTQPIAWNLADAGQAMTLPKATLPSMSVGGPAAVLPAALPVSGDGTPLLPQTNDALARVPAPTATVAATERPILPALQTSTSLSGLLTTAARLPAQPTVPASAPAALYSANPVPAPAMVAKPDMVPVAAGTPVVTVPVEAHDAGAASIATATASAHASVTATTVPAPDTAPSEGKPPKADTADEGDGERVAADAPQPIASATVPPLPVQQVVQPAPLPAAAQPVPQQQQSEAQPVLVSQGTRQPRNTGVQASPAESGRAMRKAIADEATLPGTTQNRKGDAVATDVARAVQATGGDAGQSQGQDPGQPRDPQAQFAALVQPTHTAPATASATPAAQEPLVTARPGQFGQAMGVQIAHKVEAGEETLRVRLNPENLGRVEVTLAFEDGNLKATVRAESQRALDLLRQDMPDLARTLDQAGVRTDAQSFRFETRADTGGGQQQGGNQQQRGQNPQQQRAQADDLEPAPAYRAIRADGQVDLLA